MLKNDLKMIPSGSKILPNNLLGQRLGPSGASGIDFGASGVDFRSIFELFRIDLGSFFGVWGLFWGLSGGIKFDTYNPSW